MVPDSITLTLYNPETERVYLEKYIRSEDDIVATDKN